MKKQFLAALLILVFANSAYAAQSFPIEAADDDENFIINGELFQAQTYCLGWDEGDEVISPAMNTGLAPGQRFLTSPAARSVMYGANRDRGLRPL